MLRCLGLAILSVVALARGSIVFLFVFLPSSSHAEFSRNPTEMVPLNIKKMESAAISLFAA